MKLVCNRVLAPIGVKHVVEICLKRHVYIEALVKKHVE